MLSDHFIRLAQNIYSAKGTIHVYQQDNLPFTPRRVFWITDVPKLTKRGGHAHKTGEQFIFCVNGGVEVKIDGCEDAIFLDQDSAIGVYLRPLDWVDIRFLRPKSKIVVLASNEYDESDYIRDYDEFKKLSNSLQRPKAGDSGSALEN